MPKIDCLRDGSLDASAIRARLNLENDLPTVLYAPTRSTISGTSLEHAQKFFYNLGSATDKAVDKIYEFLELEPPNLSAL